MRRRGRKMSRELRKLLMSISTIHNVSCAIISKDFAVKFVTSDLGDNVIKYSSNIREFIELCLMKKESHLFIEKNHLSGAAIFDTKTQDIIYLGNVFLGSMAEKSIQIELMKESKDPKFIRGTMKYMLGLSIISKTEFCNLINLVNYYINNKKIDLTDKGFIIESEKSNDPSFASISNQEMYKVITPIDSLKFEEYVLTCIESGNTKKLVNYLQFEPPVSAGRLVKGENVLRQRKNEFICACTIASRASVKGGLSPEIAYRMGSYYIQKAESLMTVDNAEEIGNEMFIDFAIQVEKLVRVNAKTIIIRESLNYINNHLNDSIRIEEIAKHVGISRNYLLTKFKEETLMSIVDYIKLIKIEEAKRLLMYSHLTIIEISEVLNFSSQSYFSAIFKELTGITPKEYRKSYRI